MKKFILYIAIIFSFFSFQYLDNELFSVPKYFPKPIYDFSKNRLTKEKIALGRALFYDPMLSKNNTIACVNCHSPYSAFTHIDHDLSHGIYDSIGTRNSLALMNLAWQKSFMWDGAVNHLDMQSLAPISNPLEMASSIDSVVYKLNKNIIYKKLIFNAFGDSIATGERTLKSISQFMLTLVSTNSKYDKVIRNETTFTEQEQNGYQLFQKNCNTCHKEPLFTTGDFANNGLKIDPTLRDFGRMNVTKNANDSLKFKIPTLRNIEFSYPYMHDGRLKKLSQVVNHYVSGVEKNKTLAKELQNPILFTSNEKVDLIAFLLTLSDRDFLFNPKFQYPR